MENTIKSESKLLGKWKVFGRIVCTPKDKKIVKYKWVFVGNEIKKDEIER